MNNITKTFPGVVALDNVSFSLQKGEIHCLVGENGAGKSTLIKVLAGALRPDQGDIYLDRKRCIIESTHKAQSLGISFVFQEVNVIDQLTVAENITLGIETKKLCFLDKKSNNDLAKKYLDELEININPKTKVINLSVAMKQIIGIAKALSLGPSIIVMDEPTSALNENELNILFSILKQLKQRDVSIIYISHRIDEIFKLGDRVTVLKDGKVVDTKEVKNIDRNGLIKLMTGKQFEEMFPEKNRNLGPVVLELKNIENDILKDINLTLRKGEVLGIAGLQGSGRTELARVIFGADKFDKGELLINNSEVKLIHPKSAISNYIGLVPEERRAQGIVGVLSVKDNIVLSSLNKVIKHGFLNFKKIASITEKFIDELNIKTPTQQQRVMFLSGGNQQKVVIAKWLCTDSNILLLDEPTRGIDVGAKIEIFNVVIDLVKKGKSVIIFSSELEELIGLCNRVIVLKNGKISGELIEEQIDQDKIMHLAS
jgi:ABC-type sugar transport system ATPase subunit